MLLPLLFASLLSHSPLAPPDSTVLAPPASGSGFLIGGQLSILDPEAGRLAFGPVIGYYRFQDLNDHLTFQYEFQGKFSTGYGISTVFEDNVVTPFGLAVSSARFNLRSMLFLELPVLLKMRRDRSSRQSFYAGVRPSINIITSDQGGHISTFSENGAHSSDFRALSLRKAVRPFDVGIVAGWSYAFTNRLSIDVRYTQGLFDMTADNFFKSNTNNLNSDLQVSLHANF